MLSEGEKDIINKLERTKVNITGKLYNFEAGEILCLINKLQKENEVLKRAFDRQSGDLGNYLVELQQKDKQIDLMAEYWHCGLAICENCVNYAEDKCKICIKQYFETKAKEKGE